MTFTITFIGTFRNYGFSDNFIQSWFKAWGFAFIIALPIVMMILPHIRRFVGNFLIKKENING